MRRLLLLLLGLFAAVAAFGAESEDQAAVERPYAHLQYFGRVESTPTFVIDAGGRCISRAREVAVAANAIGRRVGAVVPLSETEIAAQADVVLAIHGTVREAFSPVLYSLPGMLFADYRSQALGEAYFRGFGGGRSAEGGGGISRIRTSAIQKELKR